MQYVGKVGDYVYNQWNSLNPATLSGAIDIIVIEHSDGTLHCSPWHIRFGKFRIIKPSQKKIDLYVNGEKTDLPMKLGDGGEAFFVFETDSTDLSSSLMTSPVISASSSPEMSPAFPGKSAGASAGGSSNGNNEPDLLDLNHDSKMTHRAAKKMKDASDVTQTSAANTLKGARNADSRKADTKETEVAGEQKDSVSAGKKAQTPANPAEDKKLLGPDQSGDNSDDKSGKSNDNLDAQSRASHQDIESKIALSKSHEHDNSSDDSASASSVSRLTFEKVKRITQDLNIPSKIDVNGDVILDMDGYKPNSQKNIDSSDRLVHDIFLKEMHSVLNGNEWLGRESKDDHGSEMRLLQSLIKKDDDGSIRLVYDDNEFCDADADLDMPSAGLQIPSEQSELRQAPVVDHTEQSKTFIKTLRLTSEQLSGLGLQYGRNKLVFRSSQGGSQVEADLYLWKSNIPIVISDIDGTITKSDALGHVLNMFGRDWTHLGVANLFQDITRNGYNILYLTARSVGQADTTRQYLDSINQDGMRLPKGPVILSPDRTMAALRREIILKKPEVFKMACLRDINSLFFSQQSEALGEDIEDDRTPFYAGFGNRITDAISYRSVKIPSHRIFTINPNGEVHMELLELAGYKSSYLHIGELVDQFFPPLKYISDLSHNWNQDQLDQYIHSKDSNITSNNRPSPGSPRSPMSPGSPRSVHSDEMTIRPDERFTDLNYWREPIINLSDLSDSSDDDNASADVRSVKSGSSSPKQRAVSPPLSPKLASIESTSIKTSPKQDRPVSASFTSPLKNFMIRGGNSTAAPKPMKSPLRLGPETVSGSGSLDADDDIDDDDDDDYTDDDYEDDDDDDEDDEYEDDEDEDDDDDDEEEDFDDKEEEDENDEFGDEEQDDDLDEDDDDEAEFEEVHEHANHDAEDHVDQEVDDDDLDLDDGLPVKAQSSSPSSEPSAEYDGEEYRIMTASDMLKGLDI